MVAMSWTYVVVRFKVEFALPIEVHPLVREFHDLRQTTETVEEITAKFRERAFLVPQYVVHEEMKNRRYHDMLRDDIWDFVSLSNCKNLDETIARAREQDIELKVQTKCRSEQV